MKRRHVGVLSCVRWRGRGHGMLRTRIQKHSSAIVRAFVESVHALADEDHRPPKDADTPSGVTWPGGGFFYASRSPAH